MRALRIKGVIEKTALSKSTIWEWAANRTAGFPRPFQLSPTVTVWDEAEIDAWLEARKAAHRTGETSETQ